MATIDDVRRIVLALPRVTETVDGHRTGLSWRTSSGSIAWERPARQRDLEQLDALGRTWPTGLIIGIRVGGTQTKAALLETRPDVFFTIPHFDGYPAVLVRVDEIDEQLLRETLTDAWLLRVPKTVATSWLADHGLS